MKRIFVLILFLCAVNAFAQEDKPLISVFDFSGTNISEKELQLFIDFISSHIVESGKYQVIDRMQRETILRKIEFSLTGCTDESCQLEAGKLLQANEIVVGSLGTFGDKTLINIKLIEVETGTTKSSVSETYDSFNEVINDNSRLVNLLIGTQRAIIAEDGSRTDSNGVTSLEIYKETDLLIKRGLSSNNQQIKSRAFNLSPEERKSLYKNNQKNAVSGSLLNILPGFGVGSFINNDPALGFTQLALDIIGIAGVATYIINDNIHSTWQNDNYIYFVANSDGSSNYDGTPGDYIIDGVLTQPPSVMWSENVGIIGLVVYGASKILGALLPALTTDPYNEELKESLNISE